MNRQEVEEKLRECKCREYILQLPTSFGKTKIAIDLLNNFQSVNKILIVCPKLVLFQTWKDELIKWNKSELLNKVKFSTYVGLHNNIDNYDVLILDECHHITDRSIDIIKAYNFNYKICLSATIKKDSYFKLTQILSNPYFLKVSVKDAIEEDILPSPTIYLLPLILDDSEKQYQFIKNSKAKKVVECDYSERWKYIRDKNTKVIINCTAKEYITELDSQIEYYKNRYLQGRVGYIKNLWLQKAGERLKFLSKIKEPMILKIQEKLGNIRTLTFCSDIAQTERLGKNAINSKSGNSSDILNLFNKGEINHITACNMLNEGINLVNCRVGIWGYINASEIMTVQRIGRILRHKKPIIIIPYYLGTREQELVQDILETVDKKCIKVISNLNNLKL